MPGLAGRARSKNQPGNVRQMFGTGGCPLPCPSRVRGFSPTMFGNVRKCSENVRSMFGTCSVCFRSCDSPGRPDWQASSARHVRQPGHHWQPERSQARPEAPKDSPKPPGRGRPSTSKEKASVDKQLLRMCPGTRRLTARLSAHGAHLGSWNTNKWLQKGHICAHRPQTGPICGHRRLSRSARVYGQVVFS